MGEHQALNSAVEVVRLHLGDLQDPQGRGRWPVHGFVLLHPRAGAILVDTGIGGPDDWLADWRCVNVGVDEALQKAGLSAADVKIVINTHLHFDHCGQNAVFRHAPFYVQRTEFERAQEEESELRDWFDFAGARFEFLEGDVEIVPGVRVMATPGHTRGHQVVLVEAGPNQDVLIGDAAYQPALYLHPERENLPEGQAADREAWSASLRKVQALEPRHVHFCHATEVLHSH